MPKKTLNALFVKNVKPDPEKVTDYSDQEIDSYGKMRRGFLFRVSPRGMKSWVARLKYNDGPKKGYYYETKIGEWPKMELAEARSIFDQWRHFGIPEPKMTVDKLCDKYLEEHAKPNKVAWYEDERMLKVAVRPAIGDKEIDKVTKQDIREIIGKVKDRGAVASANIHLAVIRKMFNFAIDEDLLTTINPCYRLKAFSVDDPRPTFLNESQLKTFLTQLPTTDMPETMRQIFMLQLQTVARISEVRGLRWDELDLKHGVWTLPVERSKTKTEHRILLSGQSIQLLQAREDNDSDYVFPQRTPKTDTDKCYDRGVAIGWLVNNRKHLGMPDRKGVATHSLRHTANSNLASMGYGKEIRDRICNHKSNSMDARYQHYEYDEEAKAAWQDWADRITLWSNPTRMKVVA